MPPSDVANTPCNGKRIKTKNNKTLRLFKSTSAHFIGPLQSPPPISVSETSFSKNTILRNHTTIQSSVKNNPNIRGMFWGCFAVFKSFSLLQHPLTTAISGRTVRIKKESTSDITLSCLSLKSPFFNCKGQCYNLVTENTDLT